MKEVGRISLRTMKKRQKIGLLMMMVGIVMMFSLLEEYLGLSMAGLAVQVRLTWGGIFLGVVVLWIVLHEGLHGVFFWRYTRKVKFGIKLDRWFWILPYASSPHSMLSRKQMVVTALAPQILTVILAVMFIVAIYSNQPIMLTRLFYWLSICSFFGGALDIWGVIWLSQFKGDIFVQDIIDGAAVYERVCETGGL